MFIHVRQACQAINSGKLLVYPTESVFGIGCQAFNEAALKQLRKLKRREAQKGFIVLVSSVEQLRASFPEISLSKKELASIQADQKHPTTWLITAPRKRYSLLMGHNHTIAIRITGHPLAKLLCENCGPIVSSSANPAGKAPARSIFQARRYFRKSACYLNAPLGHAKKTSQIIDLASGEIIRAA